MLVRSEGFATRTIALVALGFSVASHSALCLSGK